MRFIQARFGHAARVAFMVVGLLGFAGPSHGYMGDYESTYWRAWIMVSQGKWSDAAKSARISLAHMAKRYGIVEAQMARFEERAATASPEDRAALRQELGFLAKRLAWMDVRKNGNEWIVAEAEKPGAGVLPYIQEDAALVVSLYQQATLYQVRAANYEQRRGRFDEADAYHQEALRRWDDAAKQMGDRLAALRAQVSGREPSAAEAARLAFLEEWAGRYADTATGLRSEYERLRDPRALVANGLFYRQRARLYEDDPDSEFRSTYRARVQFYFDKALWRCRQLLDRRDADPSLKALESSLDKEQPDPEGEPCPASYYDAVTEEYKMYTYFYEFWREGATGISID
mgnify:CR=1 FL=1